MKKHLLWLAFLLVLCLLLCVASCTKNGGTESVDPANISTTTTAVTSTPTSTPIPTYAPGTELYGMLSITGEVVLEPTYEYLDLFFDEGLARFEDHGLWGFVNEHGEEVIPAQYKDANNFSEGLAAVKVDGMWGFIDTTGTLVIRPQFEEIETGFKDERCVFSEVSKYGFIDQSGTVVEEAQYTEIQQTTAEFYIVTGTNKTYGVVDRDGNTVLELQDSYIEYVASEGYIFFPAFWETVKNHDYQEAVPFDKVLDDKGQYVYELHEDRSIEYYEVSYWATEEDLYRFRGQEPCNFIEAYDPNERLYGVYDMRTGEFVTGKMYNGVDFFIYYNDAYYAITQISRMNGLISLSTGETILKNDYYFILPSPNNQFAAHVGNDYTIVFDGDGKKLYKTDAHCMIYNFLPGFDCWSYDYYGTDSTSELWGLINTKGETVFQSEINFQWFIDGTSYLENDDGSITFIDPNFQLKQQGPFTSFEDKTRKSGIIIAYDESGKTEIINVRGEVLFSFETTVTYVDGNEEYLVFSQKLQ